MDNTCCFNPDVQSYYYKAVVPGFLVTCFSYFNECCAFQTIKFCLNLNSAKDSAYTTPDAKSISSSHHYIKRNTNSFKCTNYLPLTTHKHKHITLKKNKLLQRRVRQRLLEYRGKWMAVWLEYWNLNPKAHQFNTANFP